MTFPIKVSLSFYMAIYEGMYAFIFILFILYLQLTKNRKRSVYNKISITIRMLV